MLINQLTIISYFHAFLNKTCFNLQVYTSRWIDHTQLEFKQENFAKTKLRKRNKILKVLFVNIGKYFLLLIWVTGSGIIDYLSICFHLVKKTWPNSTGMWKILTFCLYLSNKQFRYDNYGNFWICHSMLKCQMLDY